MMSASLIVKKTPTAEKLLEWLVDPVNYAQTLIQNDGQPITLDGWQAGYLADESKFVNILKARRVGGSWVMTLKMFIRAMISADYSGTFISMNREEACGKIEYAHQMHESLPPRFRKKKVARSKTEIIFEDSRGRRAVLRSLASRAPRGRGGDVGISELPHCIDSEKIYEGALHVTSRSDAHMLTIESTPIGKQGIFYDISRGRFSQFRRYEIPWWYCTALCRDLKKALLEAPMLTTKERVEGFGTPSMQTIYASMSEDAFRQESELAFIESDACAFSVDILRKNSISNFGDRQEADLKFLSLKKIPSEHDWNWLEKNRNGSLVAGYDVGRKKDESVLFVFDSFNGRLEARMMVRLADTDFAAQENLLVQLMNKGAASLAIDSTGIGLPLAENLQKRFRDTALPVHFTAGVKTRLVSRTKMLLMDRKILLPLERNIIAQMQSVQQKISDSGNVIYHVAGSSSHHADIAWAIMLACHAAEGKPEARIHYEPVTARNDRKFSGRW